MAGPAEPLRTRLLPALLTAFGVTLLAGGLLTYTVPVEAEPAATPSPRPGRPAAVVADAVAAHHAAAARTAEPSPDGAPATPAGGPRRDPRPRRRARHRPAGRRAATTATRTATSRCTCRTCRQPGVGRRRTSTPTPARGCSCPLLRTKAREQRGHGRRGLDERRLALPVRDHRGAARPAVQTARRPGRRRRPRSSGCRPRRGRDGTPGKTQVIAEPIGGRPADHAEANPRADRSTAAEPAVAPQIQSIRRRNDGRAAAEPTTITPVTSQKLPASIARPRSSRRSRRPRRCRPGSPSPRSAAS